MLVKPSNFLFALLVTASSVVNAANFNAAEDLVVVYDVPHAIKQKVFDEVVSKNNAVPGKMQPDRYHVTLTCVEDIKQNPVHYNVLKGRLDAIRDQHLPNAHFTPVAAKQLIPSVAGTIVLVPTAAQEVQFKHYNQQAYNVVMNFNHEYNTNYKLQKHTYPNGYNPHVTFIKTDFIKQNNLNVAQVIQDVNLNLGDYKAKNGAQMDLLQVNQPAAPAPQPAAQKPAPKPAAANNNKPAAQKAKPAAQKAKPAAKKAKPVKFKKPKPVKFKKPKIKKVKIKKVKPIKVKKAKAPKHKKRAAKGKKGRN